MHNSARLLNARAWSSVDWADSDHLITWLEALSRRSFAGLVGSSGTLSVFHLVVVHWGHGASQVAIAVSNKVVFVEGDTLVIIVQSCPMRICIISFSPSSRVIVNCLLLVMMCAGHNSNSVALTRLLFLSVYRRATKWLTRWMCWLAIHSYGWDWSWISICSPMTVAWMLHSHCGNIGLLVSLRHVGAHHSLCSLIDQIGNIVFLKLCLHRFSGVTCSIMLHSFSLNAINVCKIIFLIVHALDLIQRRIRRLS